MAPKSKGKKVQFSNAATGSDPGEGSPSDLDKMDVDGPPDFITSIYTDENANGVVAHYWRYPNDEGIRKRIANTNKLISEANEKYQREPDYLGWIPGEELAKVVQEWIPARAKEMSLKDGDSKEFEKACRKLEEIVNNFNVYLTKAELPQDWAPF
jgi:hypothetical protein